MKKTAKVNKNKAITFLGNNKIFTGKISVLVPAHNEESSIAACIQSILDQSHPADQIVVVNDGSTDQTAEILDRYGSQITIVELKQCTGNKSYAQEHGLKFITGDIFITTDADTILDKKFIENIIKDFANEKTDAVCGYVKSLKYNWLTACREIDYAMGQSIHKRAQENMNFLIVIPGCAAAFRTELFREKVTFDHDTLAEDLDFTYKLNEAGCRIKFNRRAFVYTQDPSDLHSYMHQMKRWYGGNWQNLRKHIRIINRTIPALELSLAHLEGLILPILLLVIPIISIAFFFRLLTVFFIVAFAFSVYAAIISRRFDLMLYSPHYILVIYINSFIYFSEFIKEIILRKQGLVWFQPVRRKIV